MSSIYKNILDFEILDVDNSKLIIFLDCSTYMDKYQEGPILEITLPGFNTFHEVNILTKQINILNSNTIGLSKTLSVSEEMLTDFPDGVYKYTYKICPYDKVFITKYYLRSALLQKKIKSLYKQLENTDCSLKEDRELKNKIIDIEIFLSTAKIYAEEGNNEKSSKFYQIANKFADDLLKLLTNKCR